MTFAIDTGAPAAPAPRPYDGNVTFRGFGERAERKHRQIIAQIECCETVEEVEATLTEEDLILDALRLDYPEYYEAVSQAADDHKAILRAGQASVANPHPAAPGNPNAQTPIDGNSAMKGNTMLNFDTGSTGSDGPWIQWSARGTLDGSVPPKSFYLREGSDKTLLTAFDTGVVMDVYKMKTGWQKSEGVAGQAPDWKWNESVSRMQPSPGEDYKKGFSIPCAIGGGQTATWEQAGAAAWNAFTGLVPALQQAPEGKLPVVKLTGTKLQQFKRGSTVEPILEIVKWVDRPDCLKEGFQAGVDTGNAAPAAQPAPAPQPQAAAPAQVPVDAEF